MNVHSQITFIALVIVVALLCGMAMMRLKLPALVGYILAGAAQRLCTRMQDAWIAFARSGEPGHEGLPDWPAYSRFCRYSMSLRDECSLREDPHQKGREFWDRIEREGQSRFI